MRAISFAEAPGEIPLADVRSSVSIRAILDVVYFSLVYIFASGTIPRIFGGEIQDQAGGGDSASSQAFSAGLYVLSILIPFRYLPEMWKLFSRSGWMLVFFVYFYLTIFWSADIPAGLRDLRYELVFLIGALYAAVRIPPERVIRTLVWCSLVLAVLSIVGQVVLPPPQDLVPGWTGVFVTKNFLGLGMVIGIASVFADRGRWTVLRGVTLVLCAALLVLSESTTSYVCVLLTVGVVAYVNSGRRSKLILLSAVAVCAFVLIAAPDIVGKVFEAGGKDSNLTGRGVIWEFAYEGFLRRPIFGYGASGFWLTVGDLAIWTLGWNPYHAHNGYIEIALRSGSVGLVLLVLALVSSFVLAYRLKSDAYRSTSRLLAFFTATLLVHDLAETDFMAVSGAWFCFLVAYFLTLRVSTYPNSSGWIIAPKEAA